MHRERQSKDLELALERGAGEAAFGLDAEGYHAVRLPYPKELYDELFSRLPVCPTALEIGAGTGLVTRALLERDVSALTAIEPDPALAEFIKQRLRDSRLTVVRSVFPDSLIHGQFDLIACAAAFHWLEPGPALAKVRELLATGGVWGLWWHSYWNPGMGDELADAISPLLKDVPLPPSMTIRGHCSLDERMHRRMLEEAGFRAIEYRLYRCERELTTQDVLSLYKSYSFVRLLPIERRVRLLENLAQIVEKRFGGIAPNLVLTPLYFASL